VTELVNKFLNMPDWR